MVHFMAFGSKLQLESGPSVLEALYDVYIGVLVVGASHSFWLVVHVTYSSLYKPLLRAFRRLPYKDKKERNDEGLKLVAVGFGRTGTVSNVCCGRAVTEHQTVYLTGPSRQRAF